MTIITRTPASTTEISEMADFELDIAYTDGLTEGFLIRVVEPGGYTSERLLPSSNPWQPARYAEGESWHSQSDEHTGEKYTFVQLGHHKETHREIRGNRIVVTLTKTTGPIRNKQNVGA